MELLADLEWTSKTSIISYDNNNKLVITITLNVKEKKNLPYIKNQQTNREKISKLLKQLFMVQTQPNLQKETIRMPVFIQKTGE